MSAQADSFDSGSHQHQTTHDDDHRYSETRPTKRGGGWRFATFLAILLLLAAAVAAGFYYLVHLPLQGEANTAAGRVRTLEREAGRMEARMERLTREHAAAIAERDRLQAENQRLQSEHGSLAAVVQERDAQIAALEAAQHQLEERFGAEIRDGTIRIRGGGGRLSVGLSDRILFASGQAGLTQAGKAVLRRVAESLAQINDRLIQVEGHTDGMQPSAELQERFPTNWELSTTRASNVVRFFSEECQIPGRRLMASGFSQFHPVGNNGTEAGRRLNRRIEINLIPIPPR